MQSLESLFPLLVSALAIYLFFRWVVRDMNGSSNE
ncbi:hypothetical protein J2Z17_000965 [Rhizobium halophytocola]|uniref:Uncharacterized protein n=1 Tax=Rhizobium halophytocola TaxID=735519 RepID=A0ABS4DV83_9HYPH|nr:hypothetical protein [Rhizobium halophytocola]